MVDIILEGVNIREKRSGKATFNEEYKQNMIEVLQHLSKLRRKAFSKHVTNGRKFKIVLQGSKFPEYDAPWVRIEKSLPTAQVRHPASDSAARRKRGGCPIQARIRGTEF